MAAPRQYVSESMEAMRKAYLEWGLTGLAEEIQKLDQHYAPLVNISRLSAPVMIEHGMLLLAQIPREMLLSILDNTLVRKYKAGTITLQDWNFTPRSVKQHREPVIYVNYYTTPDGTGLTIAEYEQYLQAMEDAILGKKTSVNGVNIVTEVNKYYKQRTNEKGAFLTTHKTAIRRDLPDFLKYQQKVVAAAKAKGAGRIRFPGEVGWAINTDSRVKTHHKLQGSAIRFRLTMCVVSVLFPNRNFELNSFALFRVVMWNHAEIGESIGSHLVNSYAGYGGFSFTTAGISVNSAIIANAKLWMTVCAQYEDVIDYAHQAVLADRRMFEAKVQELEEEMERRQKLDKLAKLQEELDELLEKADDNSLHIAVREETKKVNGLQRVFQKQEGEVKKCYDNLSTLAAGFQLLEVAPSTVPSTVLHHSSGSNSSNASEGVQLS
ncbi:hypothetical protein KCV07_g8476, partial [Aureobasidium melanogenum]